eukprot:4320758-Pleurochrysis_carterae.AAC.5
MGQVCPFNAMKEQKQRGEASTNSAVQPSHEFCGAKDRDPTAILRFANNRPWLGKGLLSRVLKCAT